MKKGKFLSSLAAAALSASMLFAPVATSFAAQDLKAADSDQDSTRNVWEDNNYMNPGDISIDEDGNITEGEEVAPRSQTRSTNGITLHKIILNSDEFNQAQFPAENDGKEMSSKQFNEKFGTNSAKEVDGVAFRVYQLAKNGQYTASQLGITTDEYTRGTEGYSNAPAYADAKFNLVQINGQDYALTTMKGLNIDLPSKGVYAIVEDKENTVYGKRGNSDEKALTSSKAIPTVVAIPALTASTDGRLHIYPKNTESKPRIDKNYSKEDFDGAKGVEASETIEGRTNLELDLENPTKDKARISRTVGERVPYLVETELDASSAYTSLEWADKMTDGLTYDRNLELDIISGEKDQEGNVVKPNVELVKNRDYIERQNRRGFKLFLTPAGLQKINNVTNPEEDNTDPQTVRIRLRYSATINKNAVVDTEDINDIGLDYDNNPQAKSNPLPPNENGEITAKKTWGNIGEDEAKNNNYEVLFSLFEIVDGKEVLVDTQVGNASNNWKYTWTNLEGESYRVEETAINVDGTNVSYSEVDGQATADNNRPDTTVETTEVTAQKAFDADSTPTDDITITFVLYDSEGNEVDAITRKGRTTEQLTANFTNLPEGRYYVIENVSGYRVNAETGYAVDGSTITLTNSKKPYLSINPSEPEVVTGGKRFVKTDDANADWARLDKATFVVQNAQGQYLATKSSSERARTSAHLEEIEAQIAAIPRDGYENEEARQQAQAQLRNLEAIRDSIYRQANSEYKWVTLEGNPTNAQLLANEELVKVTSNETTGNFEIKGLEYGSYNLREVQQPDGYALNDNQQFPFTVERGSFSTQADGLGYESDNESNEALRIENKKLTIPQTGGIGSLIFIVAGLALMGVAFVAMKRRNSYEEA